MSLLDVMERRLGRFAIHHLSVALVVGWVIAFFMAMAQPEILGMMVMDPELVARGQWWRVFTFLLLPPTMSPLWFIFAAYLFWMFGSALESHWGAFRYNVYIGLGWLITVAVSLLHLALPFGFGGSELLSTNLWIVLSVQLAFAVLFPDFQLLLFFILPVKMKWLALIIWLGIGWQMVTGSWSDRALIVAALANYFIFFTPTIIHRLRRGQRALGTRLEQQRESRTPFHTCHVCGVTDVKDPERVFRVDTSAGSKDICLPCLEQRKARSEA